MSNASFAAALAAVFETALTQAVQAELNEYLRMVEALAVRVEKLESRAQPGGESELPDSWAEAVKRIADSAADEAISDHLGQYDHDDYDSHLGDDDKHPEDDADRRIDEIREEIRSQLNNASVSLDVSW